MADYRPITATRGGVCGLCGQRFKAGAPIVWRRGSSARHVECHRIAEARIPPA